LKPIETLNIYINNLAKEHKTGSATEHSYRGYLKDLIEELDDNIIAINEPKRVKAGAPDYLIATKSDTIEIGHIEAKDIGKDINSKSYKEQFTRYKDALENLIITDYMKFQFFKNGEAYEEVEIAKLVDGNIVIQEENFEKFINLVKDFTSFIGQSITSSSKLAKMMAHKAKLMANVMLKALEQDIEDEVTSDIVGQYKTFQQMLIHDMTPKDFADMYAQTITYGMFTARFHDTTLENFSRQEAASLVPHSNPFLRSLFQQIAGYDLDTRLDWIVDSLVKIFLSTDVKKLLENFGSTTGRNDPIIHFYEEFLAEFDPKLRKARGVWYTPESVVKFIVRAVDEVLVTEFDLPKGLGDTSKISVKVDTEGRTKSGKIKTTTKEVHKVQVLDPATGTGTFLAETIKFLYEKKQYFKWNDYVKNDLIPRLHGFEIVMASYAMAHLKLDLLLKLTGYDGKDKQRLKVYLTNSLEEYHEETGNLFASFLARESQEADKIKKEAPVMVVMGNPPYSGHSSNKNEFIDKLMEDYKKEFDGSKLKEKNSKWINDDYVKFIRYSESYIQKNGEGILAFITNHSYLDNPTFRGMRSHLLRTFDKIYILDLHGNSKKLEKCPDGSKDENVFDIMQGVAIIIGVKKKTKSKKLAELFLCDLYGKRDFKYDVLDENSLKSLPFEKIKYQEPQFYFVKKDFELQGEYEKSFSVEKLFPINSVGIVTARDKFTIQQFKRDVEIQINDFVNLEIEDARNKYNLGKDVRDWKVAYAQKDLLDSNLNVENILPISYRPFDIKYTYFTGKSKGYLCMPRGKVMKHFKLENLSILICRQAKASEDYSHLFITNKIFESCVVSNKTGEINYGLPLYLYPEENTLEETKRTPNLDLEIVAQIEKVLNLKFTPEKEDDETTFAPIDILDYIYAILHSPTYREKYKEFLKIDFPRVPFPNTKSFWKYVALGKELRSFHLLENPKIYEIVIALNESENNTIERKIVKKDVETNEDIVTIWLNDEQHITNIPLLAWKFYIGGYQPAQKWLKDRKGRVMGEEDYEHYNKIIVSLINTHRIMQEIDKV